MCRDGGTGRRSGLKIRRGQPHGGSTPPPGTKNSFKTIDFTERRPPDWKRLVMLSKSPKVTEQPLHNRLFHCTAAFPAGIGLKAVRGQLVAGRFQGGCNSRHCPAHRFWIGDGVAVKHAARFPTAYVHNQLLVDSVLT
jgi:hypothetical protein